LHWEPQAHMTSVFAHAPTSHNRTVYNISTNSLVTSVYNLHVLIVSWITKNKTLHSFWDLWSSNTIAETTIQCLFNFSIPVSLVYWFVTRQLCDAWTACPPLRATSRPAVPYFHALSPHNLLTAPRTPADSRHGTDPTCAAPTRLPTELKVKRVTESDYIPLPNPMLPSVCLVHATQSVGMLPEGETTIIYHANSRACAVIFCAVVLLSCINKHTVADFPKGLQQTSCEPPQKNNCHFKQNTVYQALL
jgi:hypothetical protein